MRIHRKRLQSHLRRGGLIAYATESCFGLGCDPRNPLALKRLLRLKRRPARKGLIVIADAPHRLCGLVQLDALHRVDNLDDYWPGPYTLLLPKGKAAPRLLTGKHNKLAVRIPGLRSARELSRLAGMALVSTSANRAGKVSIKHARECRRQFGDKVWVIPGLTGGRKQPSTILDLDKGLRLR